MPKTRLCKDFTNQPTNDDIFSDFEPPNSTDGSYKGTMKHIKATEAHLQQKFEEKLESVKARLKASKCKVGLKVSGSSIQLQATLPPKPGSDKVKSYQQLISPGIPANLDGLKTAEEEAYALGTLIARQQFEWNEKYLGTKQEETKVPTISELLEKFEEEYFKTHKRDIKSEHTFTNYKRVINSSFIKDKKFNSIELKAQFDLLDTDSKKWAFLRIASVLNKVFKLNTDLSILKAKRPETSERVIPSDKEIIEGYDKYRVYALTRPASRPEERDNWQLWQWVYGMLATYGLRPRELFVKPDLDWWLSPDNVNNTWKVSKDTKTGYREVIPFMPDWVELFNLKNQKALDILTVRIKNRSGELRNSDELSSLISLCSNYFKFLEHNFSPYCLRHACAIRAHMQGIPIKASADNLGHSIDEHTRTYQKWFGMENRKLAFNEAINKKSEVELLKEELIKVRFENEQLKSQMQRLELELQYAKLSH